MSDQRSQYLASFESAVLARSDRRVAIRIDKEPLAGADRAVLVENCKKMPQGELARAFLYAIFHGDHNFANELMLRRGKFKAHLSKSVTGGGLELNGKPYKLPTDNMELFQCAASSEAIRSVFDVIYRSGATGLLCGVGGLFLYGQNERVYRLSRAVKYAGSLPVLENGRVSSPELLLAISATAKGYQYKPAYDRVLCWASPGMVARFPESLDPYTSVHKVTVGGVAINFAEWAEQFERNNRDSVEQPGCSQITLTAKSSLNDEIGQAVLQIYGSEPLRHGVMKRNGYVLCNASIKFLSEFSFDPNICPENYSCAQEFSEKYVPFDMIARLYSQVSAWPTNNGFSSSDSSKGRSLLHLEEEIHEGLGNVISEQQWKFLLKNDVLSSVDIGKATRGFGISNSGMLWELDSDTPSELSEIAFKFSPNTRVIFSNTSGQIWGLRGSGETAVDLSKLKAYAKREDFHDQWVYWYDKMHSDLVQADLWPFKSERPTLQSAIASLARKKNPLLDRSEEATAARVTIRLASAEECARHALKSKQWAILVDLQGAEKMKPYAPEMPMEAQGKMFAIEMGI